MRVLRVRLEETTYRFARGDGLRLTPHANVHTSGFPSSLPLERGDCTYEYIHVKLGVWCASGQYLSVVAEGSPVWVVGAAWISSKLVWPRDLYYVQDIA